MSSLAETRPGLQSLTAAIPMVVKHLGGGSSSNVVKTEPAVEILMHMSHHTENLDAIAAAGALEILIQLLSSTEVAADTTDIMVCALSTICSLMENHEQRVQAAAAVGLVPVAVKLLQHSDIAVQKAAAGIVWSIDKNSSLLSALQAEVLSQAAVPALVSLLSSNNSEAQHNVAGALMVLARHNATIRAAAAGAIPELVRMLSSSNTDVQEDAAGALAGLVIDSPGNQAAIAAVQGAPEQLHVLSNSTVVPVAHKASVVLQWLSAAP